MVLREVPAENITRPLGRNEVIGLLFRLTIFGAVTYFTIKWMVDAIDPTRKQKVEAQKQAEKLMRQIGVKNVKLSEYEMSIAAHLVDPLSMQITWRDIAGLDEVITELKDTVILPVQKRHLFQGSRLLQPPKDSFLRSRSSSDHEATAMMKAQFMSLWDGLETDHHCQVIIMGATNRPQDLDSAILRRMPTRFHINQPSIRQREQILKLILENENVDSSVDLFGVAKETDGFSGSDLREMCRDAALLCVREFVHSQNNSPSEDSIRPIDQSDLQKAITKMKKSKSAGGHCALLHAALD
ncbi:outer mitochondrial transmembrane helix translocase isoform X2 [Channa argus]|uniref:outer mitochondrial transmembrane helix translocase isoform X2 n=1 Tax=Channa argus TaxID=215402 RepID=UPI0035230ECF